MEKIMKQLVFLSILLQSKNKVALRGNQRSNDAAVRSCYAQQCKERWKG